MNEKLYVGNLNFDANEEQVRELFSQFGQVSEVRIIMDRFSGRSRGFAFIQMASKDEAGSAKEALSGQPFQGKNLVIDWARSEKTDRPPRREGGEFRQKRGERGDFGKQRGFRNY